MLPQTAPLVLEAIIVSKRKEINTVDVNDDSEFLEKEISRKAGELAYKKQLEAFERDSSSGRFKIIEQVIETLGAFILIGYILWELWTSSSENNWGKILVVVVILMVILTFVFRYIAKYYYLKGDTKKFKTFNTVSKISEVSLSVADAVTPGGNKMVSKVEKTKNALASAVSSTTTLTKLDDDGGVYKSADYDVYRNKCYNIGLSVLYNSNEINVTQGVRKKVSESVNIPVEVKRDVIMSLFIIQDYRAERCADILTEKFYIQLLGALYCFKGDASKVKLIPDFIPGIGYTDDMFMLNCVLAGNLDTVKKYKGWRYMYKKTAASNLETEIISELKLLGKKSVENGKVHILKELIRTDETKTSELTEYLNILESCDLHNEDVQLIIGLCSYLYAKEDLIHDEIPDIGKVDDEYIWKLVRQYRQKNGESYAVKSTSSLDGALDNLLTQSGGN